MPELAPTKPSALLSFKAENFRSFRDEFGLSMLATALSEKDVRRSIRWRQGGSPIDVLPVAAVFGANASGKTNVFRAMNDMRTLILQSFRWAPTQALPHWPFRLDTDYVSQPTRFDISIVLEEVRHDYGFTFDRGQIVAEWAYRYPHGRPALIFERREGSLDTGPSDRGRMRSIRDLLRPNALLLSTAAHGNHPILLKLYEWFSRNLLLAEVETRAVRQAFTLQMLEDAEHEHTVLEMLRAADLGITGASKYKLDDDMREKFERIARILNGEEEAGDGSSIEPMIEDLMTLEHRGKSGNVQFGPHEESHGTLVWFGLIGPVIDALTRGAVLIADELDAGLHPLLVAQLVSLFQSEDTNPRRAQLIFNTHAVTLLGDSAADRLLGRDQIWFTEKENEGATHLRPLSDQDPRKDEAIARRYLAGRYGATPIISTERFRRTAELATAVEPSD